MRIVASKKGDGTIEKELFSPESLKQNGVALTNGYASLPPLRDHQPAHAFCLAKTTFR